MKTTTSWLALFSTPVIGAVYLVLWLIGEAGRVSSAHVIIVIFGIAIGVSRHLPSVGLALAGGGILAQLLVPDVRFASNTWAAYLPLVVVFFCASAFGRAMTNRIAAGAAPVLGIIAALLITVPSLSRDGWPVLYGLDRIPTGPDDDVAFVSYAPVACLVAVALLVGAWAAGLALRSWRRSQLEKARTRELRQELDLADAELRVLTERDLLAQEVHDVMAHSLAVIAAQADGSRMANPGASSESLERISSIARTGLVELRQLLDSPLESESHGLSELPNLIGKAKLAGLNCELVSFGEAKDLTVRQEHSVYRIVQEALTNALKHSGTQAHTRASVDWRGPGLAVLVSTQPVSVAGSTPGRGIRGVQERARIAGGWATAEFDGDDAFIVSAFIPAAERVEVG